MGSKVITTVLLTRQEDPDSALVFQTIRLLIAHIAGRTKCVGKNKIRFLKSVPVQVGFQVIPAAFNGNIVTNICAHTASADDGLFLPLLLGTFHVNLVTAQIRYIQFTLVNPI